jgi:hypothetical protein
VWDWLDVLRINVFAFIFSGLFWIMYGVGEGRRKGGGSGGGRVGR